MHSGQTIGEAEVTSAIPVIKPRLRKRLWPTRRKETSFINAQPDGQEQFIDVRSQGKGDLYPGEERVIEVEVDESFAGYVNWMTFNVDSGKAPVAHLPIEQKHINWPSCGGVLLDRCKLLSYVLQQ
jgi:hypothetical protein